MGLAQARRWTQPLPVQSPIAPTLRANPYPEVTDLICRLPLPTLLLSTRGCSPWRPAADMGTAPPENYTFSPGFSRGDTRARDTARSAVLYGNIRPYLRTSLFQGLRILTKKRELFPGLTPPSPGSFELPHLAPKGESPGRGSGILTRFPFGWHGRV